MAKRDKDPRLQELFKANKNVYSISKCNTIEECLYETFKSYIALRIKTAQKRGKNEISKETGYFIFNIVFTVLRLCDSVCLSPGCDKVGSRFFIFR